MRRIQSLFFTFLLFPFIGIAQTYFQQEVHYTINAKLDDVKNEITADESFEYINNSPNELTFIYMHLWPNAYKDNTTSLAEKFLMSGEKKFYYSTFIIIGLKNKTFPTFQNCIHRRFLTSILN